MWVRQVRRCPLEARGKCAVRESQPFKNVDCFLKNCRRVDSTLYFALQGNVVILKIIYFFKKCLLGVGGRKGKTGVSLGPS